MLADVVRGAALAAGTPSRTAKAEALADVLRALAPDEAPIAVGLLLGRPRQGRTGVGWRTLEAGLGPPAAEPSLTLTDLDAALDDLAALVGAGEGSVGARREAVAALLGRATASEQEFLVRTLTDQVRTGALAGVLTEAIARAAGVKVAVVRRAAMLSGDLGATAARALAGDDLAGAAVTPGVPVSPMLAASAKSATEAITATGPASVEYKLDGARLQVHRVDGAITAYTRSLADVTGRVPEVVEVVAGFGGGDLILDGETLTLGEDGAARPFAETMSRFGARGARDARLAVWFFDVLHAEGRELLDEPLSVRREVLARVAGDRVVGGAVTSDAVEAERVMAEALASGHEGVVVKALDAPYAAGRRGRHWVKVKPAPTFDLVVLGSEWGYGRRTGRLSNLHLGARDPEGRFGEPGGFVMVGKTFKGLTDALLAWQTEYFPTIESRRTASTVFVEPTTVVEVAIDGVQHSTRYPGGVALRFARVKRYRVGTDAKPAAEADTIDDLRALLPAP